MDENNSKTIKPLKMGGMTKVMRTNTTGYEQTNDTTSISSTLTKVSENKNDHPKLSLTASSYIPKSRLTTTTTTTTKVDGGQQNTTGTTTTENRSDSKGKIGLSTNTNTTNYDPNISMGGNYPTSFIGNIKYI
jgi:hypothetical protein